jgi:hypothetical protein
LRVLTGNVGGSFGMKASAYPEYVCMLHAAKALGRPVKWTDERSGSFLSDSHGRDHDMTPSSRSTSDGSSWPCASPATAISAPICGERRADAADAQCREEHHQRLPHAADRGLDQGACSPTPRRSAPIAAPAGPRATTTWSG